jgi:hypothetical protein
MGKVIDKEKFEAFARGVASGISKRAAASAVGYGPKSTACYKMAKKEAFQDEVRRLELEIRHGGSSDLAPIIGALMDGAYQALAKGEAAHMSAAARMLAEAGRLKQKLRPAPRASGGLTDDEWAAKYGPKS